MQIYIIRHGQSTNNAAWPTGPYVLTSPLTDLGRRQAQLVAGSLAGKNITRLYCSPMLRTLETAQPIAEALGLTPEVWIDLHERGGAWLRVDGEFKNFPGMTRSEIQAQFPDYILPDTLDENGWWWHADGLETHEECDARGRNVVSTLLRSMHDGENERIVLVSHGTISNAMLRGFFGLPVDDTVYFRFNNTGVTKVEYEVGVDNCTLAYHNQTAHLPPEMGN